MRTLIRFLLPVVPVATLAFAVSGCAATDDVSVGLDGVKWIAQSVVDGRDAMSYGQQTYPITQQSRLLLRFEDLQTRLVDISKNPALLHLHCKNSDIAESAGACEAVAKASLKLCFLTRPWMMLATWTHAHPYGQDGLWSTPGGDFESSGCLRPEIVDLAPVRESTAAGSTQSIVFNVSPWVQNYGQGGSGNLGWILVMEGNESLEIYGENSGVLAPRMTFTEFWKLHIELD